MLKPPTRKVDCSCCSVHETSTTKTLQVLNLQETFGCPMVPLAAGGAPMVSCPKYHWNPAQHPQVEEFKDLRAGLVGVDPGWHDHNVIPSMRSLKSPNLKQCRGDFQKSSWAAGNARRIQVTVTWQVPDMTWWPHKSGPGWNSSPIWVFSQLRSTPDHRFSHEEMAAFGWWWGASF
jgi:hypothetical protein